jgi:hypothetical protein
MVKLSKIWKIDCNVYLRVAAEGKFFVCFFLLVGLVAESFRLWARKAPTPFAKKICGTKGKSLFLKTWGFLCRRAGPNPWGYRDVFGPDAFSFHPHGLM